VLPRCSDNGMPSNLSMRHLAELHKNLRYASVEDRPLPTDGRARLLLADSPVRGVVLQGPPLEI